MTTRHFEVVIVGATAPAIVLAALLAKRGIRGLLVDQGELGGREGSLAFELGLIDEGSPAMELVHAELGVAMDLRRKLRPAEPSLQIILPDERFDLPIDRPTFEEELQRIFGERAPAMSNRVREIAALDNEAGAFLTEVGPLPPDGFFARRRATQLAKRHPNLSGEMTRTGVLEGTGAEISRVLLGLLPFVTHMDAERPSNATGLRFARAAARVMRGLHHFDPGQGVRELLLEVATRSGFELMRSAVAKADPNGKLVRLGFAREHDEVTTDTWIDASSDLSGLNAISLRSRPRGLADLLQAGAAKGSLHVFILEVDRAVIPPGMGDQVLLLNGRKDPRIAASGDQEAEDRPILLLKRPILGEPKRARLVAMHALSSARAHAGGIAHLEAVMRARIERLIPFLQDGNVVARGVSANDDESRGLIHPLFDPELDPIAGVGGVSMFTPYKNVFIAGPCVLPGLGLEGAYLTALEVAEEIEALLGRKKKKTPLAERLTARAKPPVAAR